MLKKIMPITAVAMALMAAPAMAQNTGHVGLAYSNNDDAEIDAWAIEGATTFAFSDAIGAQVDGSIGTIDGDGDSATAFDINGHLFYNGGAWRAGAVFGAADVDTGGINPSTTHWGVEGVYWLNGIALGGSAIWGDGEGVLAPDFEFNNYDFNADFYASENFVIGATFGVGSMDNGFSEIDTSSYGVNAEWQMNSMPLSLLAGYTHWEVDDIDVESEAFTIGARWNWGGATLAERDRAGFRNTPASVVGRYFGN